VTCKFAPKKFRRQKIVCKLYSLKAGTCNIDDGGPFVKGFAYCGQHNILNGVKRNSKKMLIDLTVEPILTEA
jgi:hypothetical protein